MRLPQKLKRKTKTLNRVSSSLVKYYVVNNTHEFPWVFTQENTHPWVFEPLPPQNPGQDQLNCNKGVTSIPDGECGYDQDRPCWRPKQIPWDSPSARAICLNHRHPLHPPARPGKNINDPLIYTARGGTAHPLII